MNSYYGGYRTGRFCDLWEDANAFKSEFKASPLATYTFNNQQKYILTDESINHIYALLWGRYADRHYASDDSLRVKNRIYGLIFQYGPTWQERINLQHELANMTIDELMDSGTTILNMAEHDQTEYEGSGTDSTSELPYINNQQVHKGKKNKVDALAARDMLLRTDVTEQFLSRFDKLFIKVVAPDYTLLYANLEENY